MVTPATFEDTPQLLLQAQPADDQIRQSLAPVGFSDWQAAYRSLNRLSQSYEARQALAEALPQLLLALADTANPNQVLVNFERFAQNTPEQTELFHDFAHNPRPLEILFSLFEGSQFLTEILLRHPHYFSRLTAHHRLAQPKSAKQLLNEAQVVVMPLLNGNQAEELPLLNALRHFQRWELLRIGASDLLGKFDLATVTTQLSYLAGSLAQTCLEVAAYQTGTPTADFVVIALGKLGGEELNYSSDIDLLFLSRSNPGDYFRLGQALINALTRTTAEGFLYRVDMRLRPWGSTGALVTTLEGYLTYLAKHAGLWEKQALLKARPIAGSKALGHEFMERIQPLLFDVDREMVRREVHRLKQRIEGQLHRRGRQWGEVKLGQGSIRDIEFVTQYRQLIHGGQHPDLRTPHTLTALNRLFAGQFLSADEYRVLTDGYTFLRTVEHHLQLMHYQQTHKLPNDPKALDHLAQRLGFRGAEAGRNFVARYEQHSAVIRVIYQQQLGTDNEEPVRPANAVHSKPAPAPNLLPHLARMHPSYVTTFSEADIKHHAWLAEQLDPDHPVTVETQPLGRDLWQLTVVGYDFLGKLSLICGLLFVHGFNIIDGHVFTYGPPVSPPAEPPEHRSSRYGRRGSFKPPAPTGDSLRKIVDVFTVQAERGPATAEIWQQYAAELSDLVRRLQQDQQHEVQGELAKRVVTTLPETTETTGALYPVDIEIDNDSEERHTVLRITAPDTIGFLYEFTNALALSGINIRRMVVASKGNLVQDTLYVTDAQRRKITDPAKQRELRVATALIKEFTHLLPRSPNPESALLHFREFLGQLFMRPNWPDELTSLERPEVLNTLARLLGISDFLWKDFLRMQHANLFPVVEKVEALKQRKSKRELAEELETLLQQAPGGEAQRETLNAFKDREMFRIDMRQIQGHINEFGQFSGELTDLAEVVVEAAYHLAARNLRASYGLPRLNNRQICPISICVLGKCGGRELGFASDIELMFIYAGNGRTTGPRVITTAEFFNKLVQEVSYLIQARHEGIFEIDLQLRPYGKAGSMAVSLESFRRYFAPGGEAWPYERQALVRLRPIAGDEKLGQQVIKLRDEFIYTGQPFDIAAMRAMRERQVRHLVTAGTINVKFSPGGLVDIEYLVQGLQITYGHRYPRLRVTNTHEAIVALTELGLLSPQDYEPLYEAHVFLRRLINALRMVRGHAKDLTVPPEESEEFAFLARRLGYSREEVGQLRNDLLRHTTAVQEINVRLLG